MSTSLQRSWLAVVGISVTFAVGGCSAGSGVQDQPDAVGSAEHARASSTPSESSSSDSEALARRQVLSTYRGMWRELAKVTADPRRGQARLDEFAFGKALSDLRETVFYYQQRKVAVHGRAELSPRITRLDLNSTPKVAAIRDCYDSRDVRPVYVESGKEVHTPKQNLRYLVTARAEEIKEQWYVVSVKAHRGNAC